ncbi:hypothetical protein ACFQV2_26425 [Actinokineospora soli]|uniref:Uncharacterized protein n=1 Tax=Actinokineospora soli TaxID=1048753 RepID=A0ABW2TUK0_9PSEU
MSVARPFAARRAIVPFGPTRTPERSERSRRVPLAETVYSGRSAVRRTTRLPSELRSSNRAPCGTTATAGCSSMPGRRSPR